MGLKRYLAKRRFNQTPEPAGRKTPASKSAAGKTLQFVIQEHHASRLHYDFRLEMDGVLKSWAVPKGPSLDPHEHHLAIQVEDHPYEYRTFEGVIPEGNYGAGNVIIWDAGTYEPRTETDQPEKTLLKELKDGHITFVLHGKKLQGEFALIKMPHAREENAWLLIKKGDSFASTKDVTKQDTSIKSGKRVDEVGETPHLGNAPKSPIPKHVQPMLCTLVDAPFDGEDWLFEIKWDGYRAIGSRNGNELELYSRNGLDFREKYSPVVEALHSLKHDVVLDGEITAIDSNGSPHFEWLQGWHTHPQGTLRYFVFDILWCDGQDVRHLPLLERKKLLKSILPKHPAIAFSDHIVHDGKKLFAEMQRRGLEGVVAKKVTSTYKEHERGNDWLKIKTHLRQEVVIGGFTEPRGSREYLGALITGVYRKGELHYVGHSGGGIPDEQRKLLRHKLDKLERKTSPFATEPKPNAPVHWVKPELLCEMEFSEWTSEGMMRHPRFVGLREDKSARQVIQERPKHTMPAKTPKPPSTAERAGVPLPELTHLEKVFFPKHKYTKGDLITYYTTIAPYILPYLKDRPHSMLRQPGGSTDHGFFQKNNEHLPEGVPFADLYSESNKGNIRWITGGHLETLLYMVQLGCIEINPWSSRIGHLDKPDWAVIDLDPEGVPFETVITVAQTVHSLCEQIHLKSYPKTSGKTGIHIFIPMGAKYTYEQVKNFAHLIVMEVNRRLPDITSLERMPEKRRHKVYLDFLQNREGQTLAAPYSVRPTPDASVSTPLHWDEVRHGLRPEQFTIKNIQKRLEQVGDLWKPVLGKGIAMHTTLEHLEKIQGHE